MAKHWIAEATSKNKGAFSAKAKRAGMSTAAYADKEVAPGSEAPAKTKRQAVLAERLMGFVKKRLR